MSETTEQRMANYLRVRGEDDASGMMYRFISQLSTLQEQAKLREIDCANQAAELDHHKCELGVAQRDSELWEQEASHLQGVIDDMQIELESMDKSSMEWFGKHERLEGEHNKTLYRLNNIRALSKFQTSDIGRANTVLRTIHAASVVEGQKHKSDCALPHFHQGNCSDTEASDPPDIFDSLVETEIPDSTLTNKLERQN